MEQHRRSNSDCLALNRGDNRYSSVRQYPQKAGGVMLFRMVTRRLRGEFRVLH
jgi:hypothetical protein